MPLIDQGLVFFFFPYLLASIFFKLFFKECVHFI